MSPSSTRHPLPRRPWSGLTRALAVGLGVAAAGIVAAPGQAAPAGTAVPTMVILDGSGSMTISDAPGPRIDAAKQAVRELLTTLPADARLGLTVYGTGTGSTDAEKAAGCQDVTTLIPVGPVDASAFAATVDGIDATGYTPIGLALRHAADELPNEGPRAIVLVSDGEDTCAPPPPCDVAAEIAGEGIDLTVHAIGFRVDAAARADLQCIAQATGGTYADADDAGDLTDALRIQVEHAVGGYTADGTPVSGAAAMGPEAPLLRPGQYVDQLEEAGTGVIDAGTTKWYRLEVPQGWTAHVSLATSVPSGTADDDVNSYVSTVSLFQPDAATYCARDIAQVAWVEGVNRPGVSAVDSVRCQGEELFVSIERQGGRFAGTSMTAEIAVRLEPPADATGLPGPEVRDIPAPPEPTADTLPLEGGFSFNRAAEVSPGQTYTTSLVTGEVRFFKVPLTWGQQITWRLDATGHDGPVGTSTRTWAEWFDPLRAQVYDLRPDSFFRTHLSFRPQDGVSSLSGGSAEPVRYGGDRFGYDGDYYLMLQSDDVSGGTYLQTYELTIDVVGEPEEGPVYDLSAVEQATPSASPSPSADLPTATEEPSEPATSAGSAQEDSGGIPPLAWAGVGAVALLLGAGVVWLVRQRGERVS